jgi:large subunit ribosomal protein L7/L12
MNRHEQIAARAYEIWQSRGGGHGRHEDDWRQAEAEVGRFAVVLSDAGANKIGVIRQLRVITGLGIDEARDLVKLAPTPVKHTATRDEAEAIRRQLAAVGATVEVR